ncbi:cytochrome b561 domain-containing protein 2-like [Hermetia illucens]|uniref:cytochrome b561 domain-containing protein 2-like n=1 Tax=Hermetia illucens TaxID=343691 RepID=UPI0018CC6B4B|nr:cytochrome b561 domain-containing protein 2-like [Hermetia illucens]
MSNEAESTEKYDLEDLGAEMSSRKAGRGLWLLVTMDVVFGLLDLILCGFFVYWSFAADGVVLFAWHPSLLSIGFILFMTEAINVYNNAVLMNKGRKSYSYRVLAHWVLHTFAMICITGGFAAIVWNKIRLGKHHFKTPHAIVGLITFILMFLVAAGGIATKYSFSLRKRIRPVVLKLTHSGLGLLIYWLGGVTLILGLYTKWFEKHRTQTDLYFSIAAILVIWFSTSLRPMRQIFKRLKQMFTSI